MKTSFTAVTTTMLVATAITTPSAKAAPNLASEAADPASPAADRRLADHQEASGEEDASGVAISAAGEEQCALPVTKRVGAWVCVTDVEVRSPSRRPGVTSTAARTGTWCTSDGCYTMVDNSHARTGMSGTYGWGGDAIGEIKWSSKFRLNGAQMTSHAVSFTPDNGVVGVHMSGMLLHGPHAEYGEEVDGTYEEISKGSVAGFETEHWGGDGYRSYSTRYRNHAHAMEVAWEEPSVPQGYWYAYIKSIIAEDANDDDIYAFRDETYMFRDSADGGFNPY